MPSYKVVTLEVEVPDDYPSEELEAYLMYCATKFDIRKGRRSSLGMFTSTKSRGSND